MYPEAFLERMKQLLDTEYPDFLESTKMEPCRGLRLNPLKANAKSFLKNSPFPLSPVPWENQGFYYDQKDTPGKHPYHEAGVYYIQEPSAMSAVPHLNVTPGEKILDLCAAPGGKSTQIGCALEGKGLLVTNEIHPARAKILSSNIERLGITNALVCNETPDRLAEFFPEFFDKILGDAPCSGEGMFRKNEEAVSEWSPENVVLCAARQDEVLLSAAKMLRPGGRLVYSTCTFSPEENEETMERFLAAHPDFTLLEMKRLFPHKVKGEGHFVGVLMKNGEAASCESVFSAEVGASTKAGIFRDTSLSSRKAPDRKKEKKETIKDGLLKKAPASFSVFWEETFTAAGHDFLQELQEQSAGFLQFGDQLYLLPDGLPSLKGMKVLRPGLHLGTIKKERFEPSHGLALALSKTHVKQSVNFSGQSREISAYLEGQALSLSFEDFPELEGKKGWCLVLVDDYSIGWGKLSGGLLKNHYPKGLRKN